MTEKEIQEYIWQNKDNFSEFFEDIKFPDLIHHEKPWDFTPSEILFNILLERYENMWNLIHGLYFFGYEVPLKKENDSTTRADFLGILEGANGIAVIELKKSKQTERQAFTELLAYGSHLRTTFAPMSKMDIVYILISPMEERIVRDATIHNIIYDRNDIFALIPSWKKDDVTTLELTPWIPTLEEVSNLVEASFSQSNFDIFKVVWDGLPGEWSPEKERDNPTECMIERLNKVSAYAAQIMEARGIHGFVFASQAWSELRDIGHLTNSIILGGINPYKATKNRFLTTEWSLKPKEADEVSIESISMLDIIPELAGNARKDNEDYNFLSDLSMTWSNEITGIGFDVVKTMTNALNRGGVQIDHGTFSWDIYQQISIEDIYCHNLDMRLTGLIRELFFEYSRIDYDYIRTNGYDDHPQYCHGEIPNDLADISTSQRYIRDFLLRLFDPLNEGAFDEGENQGLDDL
jgi:hypothetical protein